MRLRNRALAEPDEKAPKPEEKSPETKKRAREPTRKAKEPKETALEPKKRATRSQKNVLEPETELEQSKEPEAEELEEIVVKKVVTAPKKVLKKALRNGAKPALSAERKIEEKPEDATQEDDEMAVVMDTSDELHQTAGEVEEESVEDAVQEHVDEESEKEEDREEATDSETDMIVEPAESTQSSQKSTQQKQSEGFRSHRLPITCICLDSKDRFAFTGSKDGSLIKWCLKTRKILNKVFSIRKKVAESDKKLAERYHTNRINAIAITDDGKYLATGGWDKKVRIRSPEDLSWLHTFTLHRQEITTLAFRRGYHMLYSGSADRSVMLWTLEDEENLCFVESLIGHESAITSMDTTRRERVLTSGGRDQSIRVWKIVEQAQTVFQSKHESVDVAKFINDQMFVSGGEDGNITLWTTMKRTSLCSVRAHHSDKQPNRTGNWIISLATFYLKQKSFKSASNGNPTKKRRLLDGLAMDDEQDKDDDEMEQENSDDDDDEENETKKRAVDGKDTTTDEQGDNVVALVASGSCDSKLHIWKLVKNSLELHQTFDCPGFINDLKFTSDGKQLIAVCGTEHRFGRWNVVKGVKNCWKIFEVNKI